MDRCKFQCPLCDNTFGREIEFGRHRTTDHKHDGADCAKEVTKFPCHNRKFSKCVKERFILNIGDTFRKLILQYTRLEKTQFSIYVEMKNSVIHLNNLVHLKTKWQNANT